MVYNPRYSPLFLLSNKNRISSCDNKNSIPLQSLLYWKIGFAWRMRQSDHWLRISALCDVTPSTSLCLSPVYNIVLLISQAVGKGIIVHTFWFMFYWRVVIGGLCVIGLDQVRLFVSIPQVLFLRTVKQKSLVNNTCIEG